MRLGDRPSTWGDRARRLLHGVRRWFRFRCVRLFLLTLVLLAAGMVVAVVLSVPDDPAVTNPARDVAAGVLSAVGLDPKDTLLIVSGIKTVNIGLPGRVIQGALSAPERIELDIAQVDFQRLAYVREMALQQGYHLPSEEDHVPVTVRYRDQTLHGKARLKGNWPDHWYSGKWSLRFKLDGDDRLDHMGEFGIHAPRVRNYMAEWVFQQALAREGVMGVSYRFVDVTINGRSMGTYALEQEFDDGVAWFNEEPPGPLVRFSKAAVHQAIVADRRMPDPERTVVLDVLGENATAVGYSENETAAALQLLERWRSGGLPAHDVFDLDRTARYFALSDLTGNLHGDLIHNIRFYYNPISERLEPVGVDSNSGWFIDEIKGLTTRPYYRLFFDDPVLTERYLEELERVSADGYLEALFTETEPGFRANVSVIYRDEPFYNFDPHPYHANREVIRKALHPHRAISAYVNGTAVSQPLVDLGASQPLPVEVTALRAGDIRALPESGPVRLTGKALHEPVQFQTVAFTLPPGAAWDASVPMEVECRVLGTMESRLESVAPAPRLPGTEDAGRLMRLPANSANFSFAVTDDDRRTVLLLPGSHRLAEPLIVPEGYALLSGPDTSIDLVQNASIVVRGPVLWEGTEDRPIRIGSSDGTGGGVTVLRARNASTLVHVHLGPFASQGAGEGTGAALTFLESPAVLELVSMDGGGMASLLRLVDSPFTITRSAFTGGAAPAVSVEFSNGTFNRTRIADGGGLRVSGSETELDGGWFGRIAGTAVLVERCSTLTGREVACTGAVTALASESGSTASVDLLSVRDAEVAVRAGDATTGFGPGQVALRSATFANATTLFVQDGEGTITVDGRSATGRSAGTG